MIFGIIMIGVQYYFYSEAASYAVKAENAKVQSGAYTKADKEEE